MRIGIDGLPLTEDLTGVGHYTLELANHLAKAVPADEIHLVSPRAYLPALAGSENNRRTCDSCVPVLVRFLGIGGPSGCRATFAASASIFFMEPTLKCPCAGYVLPW